MTSPPPPSCPHCGSYQLIAHQNSRMVFINHDGDRIPLLTVNFSLEHPVIEEKATLFTCTCSWAGSEAELITKG